MSSSDSVATSSSTTSQQDNNNTTKVRRQSLGGFALIENDDYRSAMGKLLGIIPLTIQSPDAHVRTTDAEEAEDHFHPQHEETSLYPLSSTKREDDTQRRGGGGGEEDQKTEETNHQPATDEQPYWRAGAQLDIGALLQETVKPKRQAVPAAAGGGSRGGVGTPSKTTSSSSSSSSSTSIALGVDHALADPNPEPLQDSLALPAPAAIMQPAGNVVANRRIEMAMLHNEVSVAQKIGNDISKLYALLEEPLFQKACELVGFPTESLMPQHRSKFKTNPDTGRSRKKEDIDQLVAKADIDRIKKLALVLTDYRVLLAEAERQRRREEKAAKLAAMAAAQRAIAERHEMMSLPSMPESYVSWDTEAQGPAWRPPSRPGTGGGGAGNGGGRAMRPEDKYPPEMLAKYGFDALETYGPKALEMYGMAACEEFGVDILHKYGLDMLERFGLVLLDGFGIDACLKYGADALRSFPIELLDKYGVTTCEKYPTDLLLLYSPEILDIWPHHLLREFPLDDLIKFPLDLLRKFPMPILIKYPAEVLRMYPLELIEEFGAKLVVAYSEQTLRTFGIPICEEALDVGLPPETVAAYRAEKGARLQRIIHAEETYSQIFHSRESAKEFVRSASPERSGSAAGFTYDHENDPHAAAVQNGGGGGGGRGDSPPPLSGAPAGGVVEPEGSLADVGGAGIGGGR